MAKVQKRTPTAHVECGSGAPAFHCGSRSCRGRRGRSSTLLIVPAVAVAWDKFGGNRRTPASASRVEAPREETARKRKAS